MKKTQQQEQVQLTAYERKTIHDIFRDMMEVLEKYIEKTGHYSDWKNRKQIHDNNVARVFYNPEEAESVFLANLFGLKIELKNRPPFFLEELKGEFYQWINATGIDTNNCPEKLKQILSQTHEVLGGGGDKFAREKSEQAHRYVEKMSDEDFQRKMNEAFGSFQAPLQKERGIADSLEGKSYRDVEIAKKFGGNEEQGQEAFNRIASSHSIQQRPVVFDDRQYELAQRKLRGEIPLESWETPEGLQQWVAELERSQQQAYQQQPPYSWR